ncbi:DUF5615 family PIN-like protein [bacterium]|nr:DUF5615 family PIN-like protein [bacterium]
MEILADENLPSLLIEALRKRGHDVLWVRTDTPGISDKEVLARAFLEERLLLTMDKDFGELAFHTKLPATCGIILIRITPTSPDRLSLLTISALESRNDWSGHFSVIDTRRVRMTPLPGIK